MDLITIDEIFLTIPTWVYYLIFLFFISIIISIISLWKLFIKADQPGWASIVPIYNVVIFLQIIRRPIWWTLLLFVPILNIATVIRINYDLVKAFSKDINFFFGMIFLPFIFYPILAFGDAEYLYKQEVDMDPDLNIPETKVEVLQNDSIDSTKNDII